MDGEQNGNQEVTQGAQGPEAQGRQQEGTQGQQEVTNGFGASTPDYEKQIAERDARIAELEGQVAEVAKSAETAEQLRGEIAELKAQGESDRIDFKLQLAGVRNVKAARALLSRPRQRRGQAERGRALALRGNRQADSESHYDRRTSAYEDLDAFYRGATEQMCTFCEKNGIDCHIKKGTAD